MTDQIQVGVIGAGANTRLHHIPKLQAIEGVAVVGVCNRSRASGDRVAADFGIPQVYETWREIVEDEAIGAVVIGTWPYMHCEMSCATLEAGKHVLCEARMAMNAAEAHRMLQTAKAHPGCVVQIVPSPFTLKFDRTLKRLVDERYAGDLYVIDVRYSSGAFVGAEAAMTWRQDIRLSGLNVMAMGIWYEALARWVGHATRVTARTRVCIDHRPDADGRQTKIEVPDHVDILADMACGAQLHMRCSEVTAFCPAPFGAFLYGRDGTLHLDAEAEKLYGVRRGEAGFAEIGVPAHEAQQWRVEEEFIGAIRGKEEIRLTSFEEGVKYMEFTEAVARSAKSGAAVDLPLG